MPINTPIGTGPYKFVSWQRDGNLVMTRNDDYWGPKAAIKEIVLKKVGEDAARVAGLLAGQGDVINNVPVEELSRLDKHPRVRAEKVEGLQNVFSGDERDAQAVRQQAGAPGVQLRGRSDGDHQAYLRRQRLCDERADGRQRDRLRSKDQALSLRSEEGQGAA